MFKNQEINMFISELASDKPAPGGGAVAGILGALSASLCSMMANLTIDKEGYETYWDESKNIASKMQSYINEFYFLMDADANSFDAVIAALKMPKSTEEEKSIRRERMQEGYKKAIAIPFEIAEKAANLFDDIDYIVKYGNRNVVTDGLAAAMCAASTINISLLNVKINLKYVKDESYVNEKRQIVNKLEINAARRLAEINSKVDL